MRPFLISIGITASHFFLLALLWFVTARFFPQGLFLILETYLLVGPLPYLYQAYARQRRWDFLTQPATYVLGFGVMLLTFGFVWQCRIEVLKIRIPLVVTDPPWMTALLLGYIGIGGFLSYLMVLLSGRKAPKKHPQSPLAPSHVTNPLLKGIIRTAPRSEKSPKSSEQDEGQNV